MYSRKRCSFIAPSYTQLLSIINTKHLIEQKSKQLNLIEIQVNVNELSSVLFAAFCFM